MFVTGLWKLKTHASFYQSFAMRPTKIIFLTLLLSASILLFGHNVRSKVIMLRPQKPRPLNASIHSIENIPLPPGYERLKVAASSFGEWLRKLPLRANNTIYLYNHQPKSDQSDHYAVIDISTGNEDLQQCADAIMRLRAEYFYSRHEYSSIHFPAGNKTIFNFGEFVKGERYFLHDGTLGKHYINNISECSSHECLMQFLRWVFIYCGTYTVDEQTRPVDNLNDIMPGDVFVKAGSPGHAMIVADIAIEKSTGKKIFLLAQGFMPAQDMHIVKNKENSTLSPWYSVEDIKDKIYTPGFIFDKIALKKWTE